MMQPGYYFHPRKDPRSPGYPQLDITIRDRPTRGYFDTEKVQVSVVGTAGAIEVQTICHPWPWQVKHRVAAGRVIMTGRDEEIVEAFTFGGDLSVESQADRTLCTIQSAAPILEPLSDTSTQFVETIPSRLCAEVEALLAQRQAKWAGSPAGFQKRLGAIEPMQLYAACVKTLMERLNQFPSMRMDRAGAFMRFLRAERDCLAEEGIKLSGTSTLEELLSESPHQVS